MTQIAIVEKRDGKSADRMEIVFVHAASLSLHETSSPRVLENLKLSLSARTGIYFS
jgi:hypothetical protein